MKKVRIKNHTPHPVCVCCEVIKPQPNPARVKQEVKEIETISFHGKEIPITVSTYSDGVYIPARKDGIIHVVSKIVAEAYPDRDDFVIPNEIERDENGNITGCKSLAVLHEPSE